MKNRLDKILVLGVILIFLGVVFAPTLNAISKSNNNLVIKKISNLDKNFRNNFDLDTKGYYFCKVDISGVGEYHDEVPIFIGWNLTVGELKIKSMFSASSNFPNFPYKLFDKYNTSGPTNGILMLFIGTKTNDPFEIHGFAALAIIS